MRPTFWQRLDSFAHHQVPVIVTLGLMLISAVPSHVQELAPIGPVLPLNSVYYWTIYRPDLLGYGAVFAVGLLEDSITGTSLGVESLMLLLVYGAVVTQHKFFHGKSFAVIWWAFMVMAALASLVKWLCISALQGVFVSPWAPLYAYLMTVALYPPASWFLVRLHLFSLPDG